MKRLLCAAALTLLPLTVSAHHGVASLGAAGLSGPGAPIETSSSATLPQGRWLAYMKLDHAVWEKYTAARDDEADYSSFLMWGAGYGFTPWFSAYLFQPYNVKVNEDNAFNSAGFADLSLMGVIGFKYDDGFRLVPANESLDDLEDWHFTVYGGVTLPTGNADLRDASGDIDPGMSLGFGQPSYSLGLTVTKPLTDRLTAVGELGYMWFQENTYADGNRARFGDELRVNGALAYRLRVNAESRFRLDLNLEANYLQLGRDSGNGVDEPATGGKMLYLVPGVRAYWDNTSLGLAYKRPAWTDLNESAQQQGAEGKEKYRLVVSFSALF